MIRVLNTVGDQKAVVKIEKAAFDFLTVKEYPVCWALTGDAIGVPDGWIDGKFIEKVIISFPATVLAGNIGSKYISLGKNVAAAIVIRDTVNNTGASTMAFRHLDIEIAGKNKLSVTEVMKVHDAVALALSAAQMTPVVAKEIRVAWGEDSCLLEFGGEPIFGYSEDFSQGINFITVHKKGDPSKLLSNILEKDLSPLKNWRSYTRMKNGGGTFLEDRIKLLLTIVDQIYGMRPKDELKRKQREEEYVAVRGKLKKLIVSDTELTIRQLKSVMKSKRYYVEEADDFGQKMRKIFADANIFDEKLWDFELSLEERYDLSWKLRNRLSHDGTFGVEAAQALGANKGQYYAWLRVSVQKLVVEWLIRLSNEWSNMH